MQSEASRRVHHQLSNALGKARLALEVLLEHTVLSEQQTLLAGTALRGLNELDTMLRDDANRHLIALP